MKRQISLAACLAMAWPAAVPPSAAQTVDDFFNGDVLQELRLTLAPEDWNALKEHYLEDTSYRCTVVWREMRVDNAGVRSRGSGTRSPVKPSLAVDFSKFDSKQRFLGMKSVILRNLAQDTSMMQERLTVAMFARIGLPYQRETHARLYVNGDYAGLYLMVEPVDTRFLLTRFGESDGYLYEFNWNGTPYHFEYLGDDPALYCPLLFEPKNHEDAPQAEILAEMIRTMNQAADAEFEDRMRPFLDLENFVTHVALEQYMSEGDGILASSGMTNFYFYRRTADRRGFFLVWDKEQSFSLAGRSIWENTGLNVLLRRCLDAPRLRARYLETLSAAAQLAGGAGGWLESEARRIYGLIGGAAREDPVRLCVVDDGLALCPLARFEQSARWVIGYAEMRKAFVEGELHAAGVNLSAPALLPGALQNPSCASGKVASGSLARLNLALSCPNPVRAAGAVLPAELGGVTVTVSGNPARLASVSSSGALLQIPWQTPAGPASLSVADRTGQPGNSVSIEVRPAAPGVFAATHVDGTLVEAGSPARPGEILVLYATGLGDPQETLPPGAPPPQGAVLSLKNELTARVAGRAATVLWAGLTPGFTGLEQVNLLLPADLPAPGSAAVELMVFGEAGCPYAIPVQ